MVPQQSGDKQRNIIKGAQKRGKKSSETAAIIWRQAMKIAKTFVSLFAMVLVVLCFNPATVFSGEGHPWDGDGEGGQTSSGTGFTDTDAVPTASALGDLGGGDSGGINLASFISTMQFIFWYHDVPGSLPENSGETYGTAE
jgi:hypothetical protein